MNADKITCTSWCIEGDGHPEENFRADQWCQGEARMTILGLESLGPALPVSKIIIGEAPAITVYARQGWYQLPIVRMNVNRYHANDHMAIDADLSLTPAEAIQLAKQLIETVAEIGGTQ